MYTGKTLESMKLVEKARQENAYFEPRRMTAEEKDTLLATYHPDYKEEEFRTLQIGVNKGEKVPTELAALLQAHSRVKDKKIDLSKVDYDVDVLIIGGGGAGASAAIEADNNGANVMIVTKLRMGDANTMMAEGGIQAADKPNDSPAVHYLDIMKSASTACCNNNCFCFCNKDILSFHIHQNCTCNLTVRIRRYSGC